MTAERCRAADTDTRLPGMGAQRCSRFEAACAECGCEDFSIGQAHGSPGKVNPGEAVVRFHFAPEDIDDDGYPTTLAFSDVAELGLSVTRDRATDEQMGDAILARLSRLPEKSDWHSVSIASVADIRELCRRQKDKAPERAFCVYDTAEPGFPMHAEVCGTKASRKMRADMRDRFLAVPRAKFRDGLVNPVRTGNPDAPAPSARTSSSPSPDPDGHPDGRDIAARPALDL